MKNFYDSEGRATVVRAHRATTLKFGGYAFKSRDNYLQALKTMRSIAVSYHNSFVVVSAPYGVTDQLFSLVNKIDQMRPTSEIKDQIESILAAFKALAPSHSFDLDKQVLTNLCQSYCQSGTPENRTEVLCFGEKRMAELVCKDLRISKINCSVLRAQTFVRVDDSRPNEPSCDFLKSRSLLLPFMRSPKPQVFIIDGFSGRSLEGHRPVLLGRGGSDLTATLVARLSGSRKVVLFKDVDGVYNADPKHYSQASPVRFLSYNDALLWTLLGAKVVYHNALLPIIDQGISLEIKPLFGQGAGTVIGPIETILGDTILAAVFSLKSLDTSKNLLPVELEFNDSCFSESILKRQGSARLNLRRDDVSACLIDEKSRVRFLSYLDAVCSQLGLSRDDVFTESFRIKSLAGLALVMVGCQKKMTTEIIDSVLSASKQGDRLK